MMKKTQRLTRKGFNKVFQSGKRTHFSHLTVVSEKSQNLHVSVVVGKKVAKSAVRRNTLRRRVYDRIRKEFLSNDVTGTYIFLLKPTYNTLPRKAADVFLTESIATLRNQT